MRESRLLKLTITIPGAACRTAGTLAIYRAVGKDGRKRGENASSVWHSLSESPRAEIHDAISASSGSLDLTSIRTVIIARYCLISARSTDRSPDNSSDQARPGRSSLFTE